MQCNLKKVRISEVPKFLAESHSVTTHATEFADPYNATHPLIILIQLSEVTNYFDVYSQMKTFLIFMSLLTDLHGIHQQIIIQKEKLEC